MTEQELQAIVKGIRSLIFELSSEEDRAAVVRCLIKDRCRDCLGPLPCYCGPGWDI